MGAELAFWTFHRDPPKCVEQKDQEIIQKKSIRSNSLAPESFSSDLRRPSNDAEADPSTPVHKNTEKRRFSLDFFFPRRRSSAGKINVSGNSSRSRDKRANSVSPASTLTDDPNQPSHDQRRRGSTRMEGNSELVAWCFI